VSEDDLEAALHALIATQKSLSLGTVDADGRAHVSYVPYACAEGAIVFAVSALAAHARHLAGCETASALIVADDVPDAYERARLATTGRARLLPARSPAARLAWTALERRHGATVAVLATLADFSTYAYAPERGRLVLGFAAAYDVTPNAIRAASDM
jgi:putative heme iron utilization protein